MAKINWKTKEEIEEEQNSPKPLTELEMVKKQQSDLVFELIMKGVI